MIHRILQTSILCALLACASGCGKKPTPSALLRESDAAFAAGNYGRAAWLYYQLKRQFQDSAGIRVSLGYTYLKLGWPRYAGGEFSRALELTGRTNATAWLGLGACYARTNDWKLAGLCYLHARTYAPNNPAVYRKLGNAFFYNGQYAQAAKNYLHAATLGDRCDALYSAIGMCYERIAQWPKAINAYEQAHKLNEKDPRIIHRLALLYRDRFNNVAMAKKYYQLFAELNPAAAKAEAEAFERKIREALVSNPYAAATGPVGETNVASTGAVTNVTHRVSTAEKGPITEADRYEKLARVSLMNELPKEALKYFRKALAADPKRSALNKEVAELYEREFNDLNLAMKYYAAYLDICPKEGAEFETTVAHVKTLREQYNRIEEQERKWRQAEEEKERREEEMRKQLEAEQRRKEFEAAKKAPQSYDDVILEGEKYLRKGDYNEARRYFQKAVRVNQSYPNAYHNLGLVYFAQTNYGAAIEYFKTALERNAQHSDSYLTLGLAYERMKRTEDAIENFNMYLDMAPNTSYAGWVRDWLTQNAGAR